MKNNFTGSLGKYEGGAFVDDKRTFGKIFIDGGSVIYTGPEGRKKLPLSGLNLRAGGAAGKTIFFTHKSSPKIVFFTTDKSILKDHFLLSNPETKAQVSAILKKNQKAWLAFAMLFVAIIGGIYALYTLKEPVVAAVAKKIPVKWEKKLGQSTLTMLKSKKHLIENPRIKNYLDHIASPLLNKIPQKKYRFDIHIIDDSNINAFALPGGIIVINKGLVLAAKSPEELNGVIAHEAAHVVKQHGLRQLISSAGIYIVVQALFGDMTGLMSVLINNSAFLLTRKYSRDYELEADDNGWKYLLDAGINPAGMVNFFKTLYDEQKKMLGENINKINESLNFLSTHPSTKARIKRLEKRLKKLPKKEYFIFSVDFNKFKQAVKENG